MPHVIRFPVDKLGKRARQTARLVAHPLRHRRIVHALAIAARSGVVAEEGNIAFKYLGRYLAAGMTTEQRRLALLCHYSLIRTRLSDRGRAVRWGGTTLWHRQPEAGGARLAILLEPAGLGPLEGEAQLRFAIGSVTLGTLTFSVLDAAVLGLPSAITLFVGGLQGGIDCRAEARIAAKANGEIAPLAMLLLAIRAMADGLGIRRIVGISNARQVAMGHAGDHIRFDYDRMWEEAGAGRTDAALYLLDARTSRRADEAVEGGHRARTRRKRAMKDALHDEIRQRVAIILGPIGGRTMPGMHIRTEARPFTSDARRLPARRHDLLSHHMAGRGPDRST